MKSCKVPLRASPDVTRAERRSRLPASGRGGVFARAAAWRSSSTKARFYMRPRNIIIGQRVDPDKVERAKAFRRKMTPEERVLWQRLRPNQLNSVHFRRQQVIDGFIADFYCHAAGLVVEVDGPVHQEQKDRDAGRDEIFRQSNIQTLSFTNADVRRAERRPSAICAGMPTRLASRLS